VPSTRATQVGRVLMKQAAEKVLVSSMELGGNAPFVVAAHAHSGAAGMLAAQRASAPGSFAVAWIDALYQLTSERIAELVTIEEE